METNIEWKLVPHSYQIADTGDYDGHYEITNGKFSIFTHDDDEDSLTPIVNALNNSGCKFYLDDPLESELQMAKYEIEDLKKQLKQQPDQGTPSDDDPNTIGKIITEAITLHELDPITLEKKLNFPIGIITKLMNDEIYVNSVPVVLFKNLLLSLHIPFTKIEPLIISTFNLIKSKETPETIMRKELGYALWENEEALSKYTNHLKTII